MSDQSHPGGDNKLKKIFRSAFFTSSVQSIPHPFLRARMSEV
jgi:hypothetical protein